MPSNRKNRVQSHGLDLLSQNKSKMTVSLTYVIELQCYRGAGIKKNLRVFLRVHEHIQCVCVILILLSHSSSCSDLYLTQQLRQIHKCSKNQKLAEM